MCYTNRLDKKKAVKSYDHIQVKNLQGNITWKNMTENDENSDFVQDYWKND